MKYLKYSVLLFVCALVLSVFGVNAKNVAVNVTIPIFSQSILAKDHVNKEESGIQQIKKESCVENVSGDGRVVLAQTYSYYDPVRSSGWIEVPYSYVNWGSENSWTGQFRLMLKSKKSLPTTASFSGTWKIS